MSELQISLLAIGIAVVLALYLYGGWQQYRYRRKYGGTFKPHHEDALYRKPEEKPGQAQDAPLENPADAPPDESEVCALLSLATDYVVAVSPDHPANSGTLAQLWQKRFDFGKPVHVCGLNAADKAWEKVIPESRALYTSFKLALQLVNRSGPASEVALADFRDTARAIATQLQAGVSLPDVAHAAERARELDKFCASVDQVIALNLANAEAALSGSEVLRIAGKHGFTLQPDGTFHLHDENGRTLYSLGNLDGAPFQHHTIADAQARGLTLLLDVPLVAQPAQHFDRMVTLARQLADDLHATLVDDRQVALSEAGIKLIHEQVAAVEARMLAGQIPPGSLQAHRLFS